MIQLTYEIEKDMVLESYYRISNLVIKYFKILSEILKYSSVVNTLRGAVTLPTTKETLLNPLDNSHLSGLIYLLRIRYYKINFATFVTTLVNVVGWDMSESITNSTTTLGLNSIEYQIDY
jgi:hypothetical protein